jgi:2'-5' RNA ligase
MAHHRLFVALRPPATARGALRAVMAGAPGARWQDDEQLHCTLRFLGELDHHAAEDVAAALGGLRHEPIAARLEGIGCFDRAGRIDALWAGVAPREPLKALHDKVGRLLGHAGIAPDERAYLPHITIARFPRALAPAPGIEARIARPDCAPFLFTEVRLYESLLGPDGAIYETVARYKLE